MTEPRITRIEVHKFRYDVEDMTIGLYGREYAPGTKYSRTCYALKILTDTGVTGEYVGGTGVDFAALDGFARSLIGFGALERERIYRHVRFLTRQYARIGLAPLDIALWDLAGKYHNAPIHKLLGDAFKVATVVRDVQRVSRLRLGTEQNIAQMAPLQALETHLQLKQVPKERIARLLKGPLKYCRIGASAPVSENLTSK